MIPWPGCGCGRELLQELRDSHSKLSQAQQQYHSYLKGCQIAYAGDYARAVPLLQSIIDRSEDVTLRFRARATVANVQSVATQYDEAFSQLGSLLALVTTGSPAKHAMTALITGARTATADPPWLACAGAVLLAAATAIAACRATARLE